MAKSGIDYFPLDVALDAKFELIEAEFGLTGFGVVVHLLQEIYGKAGYYIEWTEEVALLFARKVGLGGSVVSEIIEASIRRGMFDKEKYDKYHVLTSKGVQKRYFEAVSRRKVLSVDYNILLVNVAQICPNANIQAENVNIFSKNDDIEKQSKVEKSRVEKSKEDIGAEPQAASTPPVTTCGATGKKGDKKNTPNAEIIVQKYRDRFSETLKAAVSDWLKYKKERKDKYTETGLEKLIAQISNNADRYGDDAMADVINRSIAAGYQGIVFDWLGRKQKSRGAVTQPIKTDWMDDYMG